jgi:hypothetical protein
MIKLADLNLMETHPSGGSLGLASTHPTTAQRVQMADAAAGRHPLPPLAGAPVPQGAGWSRRTRLAVAGAILVPILVLSGLAIWLAGAFVLPALQAYGLNYSYYTGPSRGPASPWPDLLAKAQAEADRLVSDAALISISAYPAGDDQAHPDSILSVSFTFYSTERKLVSVELADADPPQTIFTSAGQETIGLPTEFSPDAARAWAGQVKVGPREALRATLARGAAFGEARGEEPFVTMYCDLQTYTGWQVIYSGEAEELILTVDATTGHISDEEIVPIEYDTE